MKEIDYNQLAAAITQPHHRPLDDSRPLDDRLILAEMPVPFVAPKLRYPDASEAGPFSAEVVFVEASAAVGKSTMARNLSASLMVPLLDLAKVPVSTGTLKTLISDLSGEGDPVNAFHAGQLPIIIDALDEGRLLSNETGFEYFLRTTGELLLQDRSVTTRPKLIIFGRHESVEDAATWLLIAGEGIRANTVEVGFFPEKDARELIDAYADRGASHDAAYRRHPGPAHELVDAYFIAIEEALGLPKGQIWIDEQGIAFAGYAPVLAALGVLLAAMDNFQDVVNRLKSEGSLEAWSVIETVLDEILKRESVRFCEKLSNKIKSPVPEETYDAREQLTFLTHLLHDLPLGASTRVKLSASNQAKYLAMVKQDLSAHPFVIQGKPANAVLGSLVLANAVFHDLLGEANTKLLADLSRQPFVSRFLRSQIGSSTDTLIDGRYVGYILNSYWNDPNIRTPLVIIRSVEEGSANVHMPIGDGKTLFIKITLPLRFYGQVRTCDVDVQGGIVLDGHTTRSGSAPTFYVYGKTAIIGNTIEVTADMLTIDGQFWLESENISSSHHLSLNIKEGAEVGWGGAVSGSYPWNGLTSTLAPPYAVEPGDVPSALINECSMRLPDDRVLVTNDGYSFSPNENKWVARDYPNAFPQFLKLLIKHDFARAESFGTYAQNKFRIHMNTTWSALREAFINPPSDSKLKAFVKEARRVITDL